MNTRLAVLPLILSGLLLSATASAATTSTLVRTALPYPTRSAPTPLEVGALHDLAGTTPLTITLSLNLRDQAGAEALLKAVHDNSSPEYQKFLTPAEFKQRFAATDADVAEITAKLAAYGLTAERAGAAALRVTGMPAAIERAFQTNLRVYETPAAGKAPAYRFHAPVGEVKIPFELHGAVSGVHGLSTRPSYAPRLLHAFDHGIARVPVAPAATAGSPPGELTVTDFTAQYNATPLLSAGYTGKGQTVAIVTLANFTVADAYAYWQAVGLNVSPTRVTVVPVDGGAGAPSDASGSDETTLDVEQSGGVAPDAKVIVYQAPNTGQAFLDAFVAAVEDNKAQSISVSWGEWEWFDILANNPVVDPYTGKTVSGKDAFNEVFLQAALQGQTLFAAAGDAGAYDVNRGFSPPDFSLTLSVDEPAASPYIVAAGGTTLPGSQSYNTPTGVFTVNIPNERVWSWDYLVPLCNALKLDIFTCGIFPVGGGGGVSVLSPKPFYQAGVPGIQKSQPDQAFVDYVDTIPPTTVFTLPAGYAGRNLPDISANADPQTGYAIVYTSSVSGTQGLLTFVGGTSFVAPQFNGVSALLGQYLHHRIGLINVPLYSLAKGKTAYSGSGAPFNAVKDGNNDFYVGSSGYSPAAGIGTLNIANLAKALKKLDN